MPIQPPSSADRLFTSSAPGRRSHAFAARRQAAPSITPRQPPQDALEEQDTLGPLPSRRTLSGRNRRDLHRGAWPVHPSLHGRVPQSMLDDPEVAEGYDGELDVVDCDLIGSKKELKRWRLSLTDFHALVAGGSEAISAYRQEKTRQQQVAQSLADGAEAGSSDDEASVNALLPKGLRPPAAKDAQPDLRPARTNGLPPQPGAAAPSQTVLGRIYNGVLWPFRACVQLVYALLRLIG